MTDGRLPTSGFRLLLSDLASWRLVSRRISWPCREFRKPPPNEKRFDAAWLPPVLETDGGDSGNVRPGDASDFVILQNHFAILQATIAGLHCTPVRWQKIHVKLPFQQCQIAGHFCDMENFAGEIAKPAGKVAKFSRDITRQVGKISN